MNVANSFKGIGKELSLILSRKETLLWELAKYAVGSQAMFTESDHTIHFSRGRWGKKKLPCMIYKMDKSAYRGERLRLGCDLVQTIIFKTESNYEITSGDTVYSIEENTNPHLQALNGKSGHLALYKIKQEGNWWHSDFMLIGKLKDGTILQRETCEEIIMLKAQGLHSSRTDRDEENGKTEVRHHDVLDNHEM